MSERTTLAERMRDAFDAQFEAPRTSELVETRDFVLVHAGGERVAIALDAIRAVVRCPAATPVPGARHGLIGIAAMRGEIVGMYELGALLGGQAGSTRADAWALLARVPSVGFVVDEFEGHTRKNVDEIVRRDDTEEADAFRVDDDLVRIVDLQTITTAIIAEGDRSDS